jgi:ribose transport system ATP-binding protein
MPTPDHAGGASASNISKFFPGTRALTNVSLQVSPGEIHGLVGGNGSGKSTLIKILCGTYQGEPGGTVATGGHTVDAAEVTPEFARAAGVHVVHQDLGIFSDLSVAENLTLGARYETRLGTKVQWPAVERRAARLIEQFEIDARPRDLMRTLSQSSRTLVAIARACQDEASLGRGLLILDEPTASLPAHEVEVLFRKLRGYAEAGQAILYVSHRLDEILDLTDRVTVLRDGRNAGTFDSDALDEDLLVELIVGSAVAHSVPRPAAREHPTPRLTVSGLASGPLQAVSLAVAPGEIVGVAGLLGSGRSTLLRTLFGLHPVRTGAVELDGRPIRFRNVSQAMAHGVAYVPENRAEDAAFLQDSVALNLVAGSTSKYYGHLRMRRGKLQADARRLVTQFGIKTAGVDAPLATLSGGNQQKAIMARWLSREPRLLLLDEPSQGVDVGARAEIWNVVREAAQRGTSVLVVSSDFEELAHVVDRAVVIRGGAITAELAASELSAARLTRLVYFEENEDR